MSNIVTTTPIDHYIQADILRSLYTTPSLPFSQLKPQDIENSLFMYHVRKLTDRGVIEKTETGFALTKKGVRWVNLMGPGTLQPKPLPRLLIQFLLTDQANEHILLSIRKGPAAEYLNKYLLPGGLYAYGMPRDDAAQRVLSGLGLASEISIKYEGMLETLNTVEDDFVYHTIAALFSGIYNDQTPGGSEYYDFTWVPIEDILANKNNIFDSYLQTVVSKYSSNNLKSFDTIVC